MNLFAGWSEADLLSALRAAQDELASGSQLESAGSGDVSSTRRIQVGPVSRIRMIGRALNALDSDKYPLSDYTVPSRAVAIMAPGVGVPVLDPNSPLYGQL